MMNRNDQNYAGDILDDNHDGDADHYDDDDDGDGDADQYDDDDDGEIGKMGLYQTKITTCAKQPSWSIYDNDGDGPSLMVMVIQWK